MIALLLFIFYFCQIHAIQWCENEEKNVICFDDFEDIQCNQTLFEIKEKQLIFSETVERKDIIIQCEKTHDYLFIFKNEKMKKSNLKGSKKE